MRRLPLFTVGKNSAWLYRDKREKGAINEQKPYTQQSSAIINSADVNTLKFAHSG